MKGILPILSTLFGCAALSVVAQTTSVTKPTIDSYNNGYIILSVSHNGKFVVYENRMEDDDSGDRIVNLETGESTNVTGGKIQAVSNDGTIAVGTYEDMPAYWSRATNTWTQLEVQAVSDDSSSSDDSDVSFGTDGLSGEVFGVSGDGRYAVGRVFSSSIKFSEYLWDLTTGKKVELNNVPNVDLSSTNQGQNQFNNISEDGRYVLGILSYSYPGDEAVYVYDRETETSDYIGFSIVNTKFVETVDKLYFIDAPAMSPSGEYVTGMAYMQDDDVFAFRYNVVTKELEVFNTDLDSGIYGTAIDNNGNVYGATPVSTPLRDLYVRAGKYWYSMDNILTQRYGINFGDKTGLDYTGTPTAVSGDGRFIGAFSDPQTGAGCTYTFYEDVQTACESVDLMGNYTITPVSGSSFSTLTSLTIAFDREVQLLGTVKAAQLLKADGTLVRNSMGINVSGSKVTITFRPTTLDDGSQYTVHIPAGTFAMAGDTDVKSRDIDIAYEGRSNTPVAPQIIYPTDGSAVSKFDYSSSNILVQFDTNILITDGAKALVYRNDESEAYEEMSFYSSGSVLAIYPTTTLYFYKDSSYKVVIPAGSLTDAGGSSANEEIVINYIGNYEREVSTTDKLLFSEDFSSGLGTQLMFYDGDKNTPTEEMQALGFDAENTPWWIGADDETDEDAEDDGGYAAMSTSAYSPAGTSDDWMVTPSIYIPDTNCYLSFKLQGYNTFKIDYLNVYVIPSTKVYNSITDEAIAEFKANRIQVYHGIADPGATSGKLAGEWTDVQVSLKDYEDQDVYIAFVNENTNRSIVFVDDIQVVHDMNYLVAIENETTVVNKESIDIYGRIDVQNPLCSYTSAYLELKDSEGNVIDTINDENVTIDKDNAYTFAFSKPLPLTVGKEQTFDLVLKLGEDNYTFTRTITDLAFSPTKRVFLEEYAGGECQNCPIGIIAMEKLEKELPDNFIGITIRTYDSDELSSNLGGYSSYLGLTAAPTAMINRKVIASPMTELNGNYVFNNPKNPLWTDIVYSELETPAVADISISAVMDEDEQYIDVPVNVTYALDKKDVNVSLFFVVVEDQIQTYQRNVFYTISDPNLGEWGAGGIYGKKAVRNYIINDIARAAIGTTFNGTQGYIPSNVQANVENTTLVQFNVPQAVSNLSNARIVAVMIDNNTDYVINAAQCPLKYSGVNAAVINNDDIDADVDLDGNVVVNSNAEATVTVYSVSGAVIGQAHGTGKVVANTNGYKGVAIARVATDNSSKVLKLIIK
jgi:hypothetical protein